MAEKERKTNWDFGRLDYTRIDPVIKDNPNLSWAGIKEIFDREGIKCSQYSFFARKAHLEGRPFDEKKANRKSKSYQTKSSVSEMIDKIVSKSKMKDEYEIVAKALLKNSTVSHAQLRKELHIKMCDANFYQFRKKFNRLVSRTEVTKKDSVLHKGDIKKLLKILKKEGKITVEGITKRLKCSKKIVYGVAFRLRRKLEKQGIELAYEDEHYFLRSDVSQISQVPDVRKTTQPQSTKLTDHVKGKNHSLTELRQLSNADFDDYLETMKKSIFYGLSAQAIISANQIIRNKKEEVNTANQIIRNKKEEVNNTI